jgi:DNA mismatch repair protein PMS2
LAVRYKDFHRNIKKHYAKLLKVLQGYALSCTNVRLSVINTSGKAGGRQVVLATQAHQRTGDNIASVFGTKFFRTLVPVEFVLDDAWPSGDLDAERLKRGDESSEEGSDDEEMEERKEEEQKSPVRSTPEKKATRERQVVGYVSKVGAGVGRSDNDRQFFFINGRPFDLPKVRLKRSVSSEILVMIIDSNSCVCADREGYQRSLAPIRDEAKARVRPELSASTRRL